MDDKGLRAAAEKCLVRARGRLVLAKDASSAFFANLLFGLEAKPDESTPTACTDGKRIYYNPEFVVGLSSAELQGVLVHEVMHVALCHHTRIRGRDLSRANIAGDLAINHLLDAAGYILPAGVLRAGYGPYGAFPQGKSLDEYYRLLGESPPSAGDDSGGDPGPDPDPGQCGGFRTPGDGSESACRSAEAAARQAVSGAAELASRRGDLPGELARLVTEAGTTRVDWQVVLAEYLTRSARSSYSWARPNRRHVARGMYLPGLHSQTLGEVVVALDTSGSISPTQLSEWLAEVRGLLEAFSVEKLTVIWCDAAVHQTAEVSWPDEVPTSASGGGGTNHRPVFEWIATHCSESPSVLLAFTDCDTVYPEVEPDYPVIWLRSGGWRGGSPPFGQVIDIE